MTHAVSLEELLAADPEVYCEYPSLSQNHSLDSQDLCSLPTARVMNNPSIHYAQLMKGQPTKAKCVLSLAEDISCDSGGETLAVKVADLQPNQEMAGPVCHSSSETLTAATGESFEQGEFVSTSEKEDNSSDKQIHCFSNQSSQACEELSSIISSSQAVSEDLNSVLVPASKIYVDAANSLSGIDLEESLLQLPESSTSAVVDSPFSTINYLKTEPIGETSSLGCEQTMERKSCRSAGCLITFLLAVNNCHTYTFTCPITLPFMCSFLSIHSRRGQHDTVFT